MVSYHRNRKYCSLSVFPIPSVCQTPHRWPVEALKCKKVCSKIIGGKKPTWYWTKCTCIKYCAYSIPCPGPSMTVHCILRPRKWGCDQHHRSRAGGSWIPDKMFSITWQFLASLWPLADCCRHSFGMPETNWPPYCLCSSFLSHGLAVINHSFPRWSWGILVGKTTTLALLLKDRILAMYPPKIKF